MSRKKFTPAVQPPEQNRDCGFFAWLKCCFTGTGCCGDPADVAQMDNPAQTSPAAGHGHVRHHSRHRSEDFAAMVQAHPNIAYATDIVEAVVDTGLQLGRLAGYRAGNAVLTGIGHPELNGLSVNVVRHVSDRVEDVADSIIAGGEQVAVAVVSRVVGVGQGIGEVVSAIGNTIQMTNQVAMDSIVQTDVALNQTVRGMFDNIANLLTFGQDTDTLTDNEPQTRRSSVMSRSQISQEEVGVYLQTTNLGENILSPPARIRELPNEAAIGGQANNDIQEFVESPDLRTREFRQEEDQQVMHLPNMVPYIGAAAISGMMMVSGKHF